MTILSDSIASLLAPCIIGIPKPAFGEEGGKEDKPNVQLGLEDKVAGEEPVNFDFIEQASGDPTPDPEKPPGEEKSPATEIRPKKDAATVTDPNDNLEIPSVKPQRQGEEEMPEPDPTKNAEAIAKKKEEDDAKAAEEAKKKQDDEAKKLTDAATAKKVEEVKLPSEEEVEAMQPKPGAPKQVIADFKKLKDTVVKPALAEVKRLKAALDEAGKAPVIDEETKKKLARADELENWYQAFEYTHDPKLQEAAKKKIDEAENNFFNVLATHPRLMMPKKSIDHIKSVGLDSKEGRDIMVKVLSAIRESQGELLVDEVKELYYSRQRAIKENEAKITELRAKQGELVQKKSEQEKAELTQWGKAADDHIAELVKDKPIFLLKQLPENATEAQKKEVEAHNKRVKEETVPALQDYVRSIYSRDPKKGVEIMVKAILLPAVEKERDELKAQIIEKDKRIKELEGDAGRIRRVATPSQIEGAPPAGSKSKTETKAPADMTADEAVDAYRREVGIMPAARTTH